MPAGGVVITLQGKAELARMHADDGINGLVKVGASAQHTGRDGEAFDVLAVPGKSFGNDEVEEFTLCARGHQLPAIEDTAELCRDFFRRSGRGRISLFENEVVFVSAFHMVPVRT